MRRKGFVHFVPLIVIAIAIIGGFSTLSTLSEQRGKEAVGRILSSSNSGPGSSKSEKSQKDTSSSNSNSSEKSKIDIRTDEGRVKISTNPAQTKVDIKTDDLRYKSHIKDGEERTKIWTEGGKIEIRTENGIATIKFKSKAGEDLDLDEDEQDEILASAEAKLDDDDIEIASGSADLGFIQRGRRVRTNFPLSVNPETGELFVSTPAGEKVVTILPDVAIQNMIRAGIMTRVDESSPSASPTPIATPSAGEGTDSADEGTPSGVTSVEGAGIEITQVNDLIVYLINGVKDQNFLGVIPVEIKLKAVVSISDGTLVDIRQSLLSRFLDLLSF